MKQLFICLLAALSSCGSTCNKDKDIWEEVEFEFAIPVNMAPGMETIEVGQELALTVDFPDSLFDVLSQKKYYLPDFNFKTVAVIKKLSDNTVQFPEQPGGAGNFSFTNIIGSASNISSSFADINYSYQNNRYAASIKLKALKKGVYGLRLYHSTGTRGQTELPQVLAPNEPGFKRFPIMKLLRYTFNNGNTHFAIYKMHCSSPDPNEATNWVESKSTYTFVVK